MGVLIDQLRRRIERAAPWPLPEQKRVIERILAYIALRENDREALQDLADWRDRTKRYRVDPLPERVSGAYATMLFGQEPKVTAANDNDQERLDEILRLNRWGPSLLREENRCSSEGEVWWRVLSDPTRFEAPALQWFSRMDVIPLYLAGQLRACAFLNRLDPIILSDGTEDPTVYRHLEYHEAGEVQNVLYKGAESRLGDPVALDSHSETVGLRDQWNHGLAMLAGRIVNVEGDDPTLGRSDYDGIEDFFLELNECLIAGAANRGLAAEKRIVAPPEALDEQGNLPRGQVISAAALDRQYGKPGENVASSFGTVEIDFDAQQLIAWSEHVAITALSRKGITPQFIGVPAGNEGYAETGVALRLRLIPSLAEGNRRGGSWDGELDGQVLLLQQLDALNDEPGFGNAWNAADTPPAVEMAIRLPEDPVERTGRLAIGVSGKFISRETAVREEHPDWDKRQVAEELGRIRSDEAATGASLLGGPPPGNTSAAGDSTTQDGAQPPAGGAQNAG